MSVFGKSLLLWLGGAIVGAIALHNHPIGGRKRPVLAPVLGGILGAVVVGSVGDATIERCQVGLWPCRRS